RAVLALGIHDIGIVLIDPADETVAAAHHRPVFIDGTWPPQRAAGAAPAAVVLQAAVDAVRLACIHADVIELAKRQVAEMIPVVHAVVGDVEAAVGADDHVPAVARVDPKRVLIIVDTLGAVLLEGLAAVGRA